MDQTSVNFFQLVGFFADGDNLANSHMSPNEQSDGLSIADISTLVSAL
jgi:hypothetical protein